MCVTYTLLIHLLIYYSYIDLFPTDLAVLWRQVSLPPRYIRRNYRTNGHNSYHYGFGDSI